MPACIFGLCPCFDVGALGLDDINPTGMLPLGLIKRGLNFLNGPLATLAGIFPRRLFLSALGVAPPFLIGKCRLASYLLVDLAR